MDPTTTEPRYAEPQSRVRVPVALLILAQLADLVTYAPAHEVNPLIHPATALPLKVALLLLVLAVASIGYRRLLLGAGIAAGSIGFVSNVAAAW